MDEEVVQTYPVESIPDDDHLFLAVHKNHTLNGPNWSMIFKSQPPPAGVVLPYPPGLSTDWSRYMPTAESCRAGRKQAPENYGVAILDVACLRGSKKLEVTHAPISNKPPLKDSQSHTIVHGLEDKDPERISILLKCLNWDLPHQTLLEFWERNPDAHSRTA